MSSNLHSLQRCYDKVSPDDFKSVPKVRLFLGRFLTSLVGAFAALKPKWRGQQAKYQVSHKESWQGLCVAALAII